jgi:hypothetical protein
MREPGLSLLVSMISANAACFQLVDASLGKALLLARRVVLGVLAQIAVRARLGDRLDDLRTLDRLEVFQFGAQLVRRRAWSG